MDLLTNQNSLCIALLHLLPCASIRLVRRPDQGLFLQTFGPAPRGPRCSGHVLLPQLQLARLRSAPESFRTVLASGGFMKSYLTRDIRNVGIVGHGGTGKTQLVSSLLFTAGMTPRWGKIAEGSTTTDWDEEEISRKISIQTGLAHAEWPATPTGPSGSSEKVKINLVDLPGYSTFITEAKASLIAADAALITVDAHVGSQVTTEKVWDYCTEYDIPRAFVLTWMDRELSSFERSMESLEQVFGRNVVALQLPIGAERGFRGVIDLVAMKAHLYNPDGDGKPSIEEIPAALAGDAKEAHEKLVEMMEEFFREGTIPIHDLIPAFRKAIVAEKIFPVLINSALLNIATASLLTF